MKSGLDPEACARNRALLARLAAMPVSGVKALADAERPPVARINELTHTDFFHGHANAEVYVTRAIGNLTEKERMEVYEYMRPLVAVDRYRLEPARSVTRNFLVQGERIEDERRRLRLELQRRRARAPGAGKGR